MKRWALALALFAFSCGGTDGSGGSVQGHITLSIKGDIKAEYFSKVFLRVSYPEGGPYEEERVGRFLPGDEVVFNLDLPEGKERTLEVFLFDQEGRPVYYRSLFLPELSKQDRIRIELLPSEGVVRSFETRSDGRVQSEKEVELFSEDLYSYNGKYTGYLTGKFLRLSEGKRIYFYFVEEGKREVELNFEGERNITVQVPTPIWLTGSVETFGEESFQTRARSSLLTREDKALLCGVLDNKVYYAFSQSPVNLSMVCDAQSCSQVMLSYGPFLRPLDVLLSQAGILCRAGYIESENRARAYIPEGASLFVSFYIRHPGACKPEGTVLIKAQGGQVIANTKLSNFSVPSPSRWRIYSEDLTYMLYAFCNVPNSLTFQVPYVEDKEVVVERLEGEKVYAKRMRLSNLGEWSWGKEDIKSLKLRENEEYLLVQYELEGDFSRCDLRMEYGDREVFVLGIPSYRRHIKIRRKYIEDSQASLNYLELRCLFKDGFVERRINLAENVI